MHHVNFNFTPRSDSTHHECSATRSGDWVVYRCPQCSDYQRWHNLRTGKMKTKGLKANIQHWGVYNHKEAPENLN